MKREIFKKLSPAQQKVVNCLMSRDSYIVKSKFYNHNKVNSRLPLRDKDYEYYGLMQFTRPTFEVLLRNGIIKQSANEHKDIYVLTQQPCH